MARPLRIEYPGAVYHITSRGNAQNRIYLEAEDRNDFLSILSSTTERFNWMCHAYCLMDNHYHLLIETIDATLSRGMRHLNGVYTQSFNRRHKRVGHVFQGRYKAILVQKDAHLIELCRYIVLNPVRAKAANRPEAWQWSSYKATASGKQGPECLITEWLLGQYSKNKKIAMKEYRKFVENGIKDAVSPWQRLKGQIYFGSEEFISSIRNRNQKTENIGEVPKIQRFAGRISLDDLFKSTVNKRERNENIWSAYVDYGYKMNEIAEYLSIHYTTVSKIINRVKSL